MCTTLVGLIEVLTRRGFKPKYWMLDNECGHLLKEMFEKLSIDYQFAPAGTHRRNRAERAIQTFKKHFIAGLLGVDNNFPMHLWDLLLPQCDITLNMLRASRVHPKISANDALNGTFNFNATPLAPLGCKVVVHEKPGKRKTWDPAGTNGFYLGPAMQHYRCYLCYVTKSKGIRNCDTVDFSQNKLSYDQKQSNKIKKENYMNLCNCANEMWTNCPSRQIGVWRS